MWVWDFEHISLEAGNESRKQNLQTDREVNKDRK